MINSKGLYIADLHFKAGNVSSRQDNFFEAISKKFTEALCIAKDNDVQYVVLLGDLFDNGDPPGVVRNRVVDILRKGNNGHGWPFEIFLVVGNHDVFSHTLDTINRTAIKTLQTVGLIQICDKSEKYGIYFGHYKQNGEKDIVNTDMPILAMHTNILPNPFWGSVLIEDFKTNPENKIVISGHYHPGYDTVYRNEDGVIFANPGALGRISTDGALHQIKVLLLELENSEISKMEYIPLQNVAPMESVFNIAQIKAKKKATADISDFMDRINEASVILDQDADIFEQIKKFGVDNNIKKEVMAEIIKRLIVAQDNKGDSDE
jgi:metallophosphoesterase superfamily enzyme